MPITDIDENNRAHGRLIAQLQTGRLIGCTGAGLSIWAGYRSWRGLIDRLATEVDKRRHGEVNTQLVLQNHGRDLLLCAQRLGSDLGEQAFAEFVLAEFRPTGSPIHDVLLRVAALPLRHTLTLNFDLSYETANTLIGSECQTISSCDRRALARFLREMDEPDYPKHAVHLHGKYDDPIQQIALTEEGYARLYGDSLFQNFVWTMAARRLFFLGFGFADTDFTNRLRECARDVRGNGLNHFALVGLRPHDNDVQIRNWLNERFLLDPIFYDVPLDPDGQENHEEFVGIVNAISAGLGMPQEAAPQRPLVIVPRAPVDPDDERRAEELNQRLLDKIEGGGNGV